MPIVLKSLKMPIVLKSLYSQLLEEAENRRVLSLVLNVRNKWNDLYIIIYKFSGIINPEPVHLALSNNISLQPATANMMMERMKVA